MIEKITIMLFCAAIKSVIIFLSNILTVILEAVLEYKLLWSLEFPYSIIFSKIPFYGLTTAEPGFATEKLCTIRVLVYHLHFSLSTVSEDLHCIPLDLCSSVIWVAKFSTYTQNTKKDNFFSMKPINTGGSNFSLLATSKYIKTYIKMESSLYKMNLFLKCK